MLDREVVKEFLINQFEDFEPIPEFIDSDKLTEDFCIYVENDYYEWLKDNYKSYFFRTEFSWDNILNRLEKNPTIPI